MMWMPILFLSLVLATDWTLAQRAVACIEGEIYVDCFHYCQKNCLEKGIECVYQCKNGCGCEEALVEHNNGGCLKIRECDFEEKVEDEKEETVTPHIDIVTEAVNDNGDERLNLMEYEPLSPD